LDKKIAVIGSGIAGLTAGLLCRDSGAEVTIFEASSKRGMDLNSLNLDHEDENSGYVDIPLRVMSPHAWPLTLKMCEILSVKTFEVDTPVACSWLDESTWFRSNKFRLGSKLIPWVPVRYLFQSETYQILLGFFKILKLNPDNFPPELTVKDFIEQLNFAPLFSKGFLFPLLTTICTCDEKSLEKWPAIQILDLMKKIVFGDRLRRIAGGTKALAEKLGMGLNWQSGVYIKNLSEKSKGIFLSSKNVNYGPFDNVICAVQANQLKFLPNSYDLELKILRSFPYTSGTLWIHRDMRFMPKNKNDWSALHYQVKKDFSSSMFSVWVNPIEPSIARHEPILQTWDPIIEPRHEKVYKTLTMERAVVSGENQKLLQQLNELHQLPNRKVFFCGSYAAPGVPLLESAVQSAITVINQLGLTPLNREIYEMCSPKMH
tara:strand:+ start:10 stop:1302 length:1293 start_codon:yes stop_codon:yes gene_type:complete